MEIDIIDLTADLPSLRGLVVVIDVLRAFTTACFVFNNGANRIHAVASLEQARLLKLIHKNWILMGERKGIKLPDFDYGNSPSEMQHVNLEGKTVILTTSSGTQAIEKLINAQEIITGAFVNAQSIVDYIKKHKFTHIHFLCTDNRWKDNEDFKCASFLIDELSGLKTDFSKITEHLINHPTSEGFLKNPLTKYGMQDFKLSLELNKFNFVIRATRTHHDVYLEKVNI